MCTKDNEAGKLASVLTICLLICFTGRWYNTMTSARCPLPVPARHHVLDTPCPSTHKNFATPLQPSHTIRLTESCCSTTSTTAV